MGKNAIVGQSGGPTSVINASLAGVFESCKSRGADVVYGMCNGVAGLLEERVVDLSTLLTDDLDIELLKRTPSSFLGSCRYKLPDWHTDEAVYKKLFAILEKLNIGYFFYIGGNDSSHFDGLVVADFEFRCDVGADGEFEFLVELELRLAFDAAADDVQRLVLARQLKRSVDQLALQLILELIFEFAADQTDGRLARTEAGESHLGRDVAKRIRGFAFDHIRRNGKVKLFAARLGCTHLHLDGIHQFLRHLKHQTFP